MSAYLVVQLSVTDPSWIENYVANVPTILRKYGGEYLVVSQQLKQYEGAGDAPHQVAIFTFPTLDAITRFMECDEYKPYKEARFTGSTATVIGIEG